MNECTIVLKMLDGQEVWYKVVEDGKQELHNQIGDLETKMNTSRFLICPSERTIVRVDNIDYVKII